MQNLLAAIGTVIIVVCLYLYSSMNPASAETSGVNIIPSHLTQTTSR